MKLEMSNKPLTSFSLSSLTDIVMLLLIFFLLTSQFVIQTGVRVKLPGAKNNEQVAPSRMIVSITGTQKIYVGTEEVTMEALAQKIAALGDNLTDANLIIRADKDVNVNMVVKVIDAAKGVGVNKFTIETEKESF